MLETVRSECVCQCDDVLLQVEQWLEVSVGVELCCGLSLGSSWPERWQRSADGPPAGDLQSAASTSPPPTAKHTQEL